ncbi:hypothetical protein N9408_03275 [Opitutales bacterium]|nr:hypothetical protein [Opitutales bacterium]
MKTNLFRVLLTLLFPFFSYGTERSFSPKVVALNGFVSKYDHKTASFQPVQIGELVNEKSLFLTSEGSALILSYPSSIVARFGENTRAIVGPGSDNRLEIDLQLGTVSALLDPNRDKENEPVFAIRGSGGVTEAVGTFYAITEYKGQTYSAVKRGEVAKKTTPPEKPNFSAYINNSKSKKKDQEKIGLQQRKAIQ